MTVPHTVAWVFVVIPPVGGGVTDNGPGDDDDDVLILGRGGTLTLKAGMSPAPRKSANPCGSRRPELLVAALSN